MITRTLTTLPRVTEAQKAAIHAAPRTPEAHRKLMADLPALQAVQLGGQARAAHLPRTINVAAWNVERCLFPQETGRHLAPLVTDVVLLSEVDHGMARTGQRHTTAEIAAELGMAYAFGVEFVELDLGGATERAFCADDFNALGWHGNAILSSVPFEAVMMVRLFDHGHWFAGPADKVDPNQPRVGGRMALAAVLPTAAGPICVVSTHLESNADVAHRHGQFEILLDAIDNFAPGMPVLIGGDLNTGNDAPPEYDWRAETLFDLGRARGYDWGFTADGMTTRASLITPHPTRQLKLDWLAGRNLTCEGNGILSSVSVDAKPLSDHDCVHCRATVGVA